MTATYVKPRTGAGTERLEQAARCRQLYHEEGLLQREIADQLGLTRSWVSELINDPDGSKKRARIDSYQGVCIDCGGPTSGSEGPNRLPERCASCAAAWLTEQKTWTREAIVDAIQRFAAEHGRPPTAQEWQRANHERGYPPASACHGFGSRAGGRRYPHAFDLWADAIEAAGFERPYSGRRLPKGEGRSHNMARSYVVLHRNGDGGWHEHHADAYNETTAIEAVAEEPGDYVAVRLDVWRVRTVAPVTRMTVQVEAPPA